MQALPDPGHSHLAVLTIDLYVVQVQLLVTEVAADQALPDPGHPQLAVLTIDPTRPLLHGQDLVYVTVHCSEPSYQPSVLAFFGRSHFYDFRSGATASFYGFQLNRQPRMFIDT